MAALTSASIPYIKGFSQGCRSAQAPFDYLIKRHAKQEPAMNSQLKALPLETHGYATAEHTPAPAVERAKPCRSRQEIGHGSGPHLTKETQARLRLRLRAAAFILLIGFGVFLVLHVVGVLTRA